MLHRSSLFILFVMLGCAALTLSGCTDNLPKEVVVYRNDFENGRERIKIFSGDSESNQPLLIDFNGSQILGPLNHNAVYLQFPDESLKLDSLPEHQLLLIEFDLYIHDAWKGNDGLSSDFWALFLDGERSYLTTFANLPGTTQAYPEPEGSSFYPGANAVNFQLPGLCALKESANGTALYHFVWKFKHSERTLRFALSDLVAETDTCLKSWSVDNLKITSISIETN